MVGHQCEFILSDGARCPERSNLEAHHVAAYRDVGAAGDVPGNLRMLCHAHHQRTIRRDPID
jgi:hypothetical protein